MKEAMFYFKTEDCVHCRLCPHNCQIKDGAYGICRVRKNVNGVLYAESYGEISSIAVDPIEKKPINNFFSGKPILSIGSVGCNLRCQFCQNHEISMCAVETDNTQYVSPENIAKKAAELAVLGNIGVAYTYNEPFISYEYMIDTAKLVRANGNKNVVVTNGFVEEEPLREILPYIDAMNIDLKSFSHDYYKKIGGELESVKRTIEIASSLCHLEVTTLITPSVTNGTFMQESEMDSLSRWLAQISTEIPLHITRFQPRYQMENHPQTPIETLVGLKLVALKHLKYVY